MAQKKTPPLPWKVEKCCCGAHNCYDILDAKGGIVAQQQKKSVADFIVESVNKRVEEK